MSERSNGLPLDEAALDRCMSDKFYLSSVVHDVISQAHTAIALRDRCERQERLLAELRPWAKFGSWAFEEFWHDAEPGDIEWAEAQEHAERLGMLRRRTEQDANASCSSECGWIAGDPIATCACLFPTRRPLREWALADEPQGNEGEGA